MAVAALHQGKFDENALNEHVYALRRIVATAIVGECTDKEQRIQELTQGIHDTVHGTSTVLRGHLLHQWLVRADDPHAAVARWLWTGAPAGIDVHMPELDGMWPLRERLAERDPADLVRAPDAFVNYDGIDEDEDLGKDIKSYRDKGFVQLFDSWAKLEE